MNCSAEGLTQTLSLKETEQLPSCPPCLRSRFKPFFLHCIKPCCWKTPPLLQIANSPPRFKPWHYWGQLQSPFAWPLRGIEQAKVSLGFSEQSWQDLFWHTVQKGWTKMWQRANESQRKKSAWPSQGTPQMCFSPLISCSFPVQLEAWAGNWALCHSTATGNFCCLHAASFPCFLTFLRCHNFHI